MSERASPSTAIRFPEHFRGIFAEHRESFGRILLDARHELQNLEVPEPLREPIHYLVRDNDQPTYLLLPLLYLSLAQQRGGVTERHKSFLPWYLLAMEVAALLDDATDCTPLRGGRPTFVERFGGVLTVPTAGYLLSKLLAHTMREVPELGASTAQFFGALCATEMIEHRTRYPDRSVWHTLLATRYEVMHDALVHGLDASLLLHGLPPAPRQATTPLAELIQDVDDLIHISERRDLRGENSDFEMGVVTYPLTAATTAEPSLAEVVEGCWRRFRTVDCSDRRAFAEDRARCRSETVVELNHIRDALERLGVAATQRKILACADRCIAACSAESRPFFEAVVTSFVDRVAPPNRMPYS